MKYSRSDFVVGIENIMDDSDIRSVTVFCNPLNNVKNRIRFTRRDQESFIVTYGKPNYREREFLKLCKKAKTKPRKVWFHFFKKSK